DGRPHVARPVCVRGQSARGTMLRLLGSLIAERVPVDLAPLFREESGAPAAPDGDREVLAFPVMRPPIRPPTMSPRRLEPLFTTSNEVLHATEPRAAIR